MRRKSPVWRTITSAYCSSVARSSPTIGPNLRRSRSAESWIGVSGFFTSCAMRRATSPQAAMRCATTRSVTSSNETTKPSRCPSPASLAATRTRRSRSREARRSRTSACAMPLLRVSRRCRRSASSGTASVSGRPARWGSSSSSAAAAAFIISIRPLASSPITPAVTPESTEFEQPSSPLGLLVRRDQRVALALHLTGHLVERASEERDLVVAPLLAHPHVEIALPHPLRRARQPSHGARQPLGEPEPHPHRAEDHHQREAEIDQRELEKQPPAVRLELLVERHRRLGLVEQAQDLRRRPRG